jgi:hypothetical protein
MQEAGRRGRNRTCNPQIRNLMLYPFELRAHFYNQQLSDITKDVLVR